MQIIANVSRSFQDIWLAVLMRLSVFNESKTVGWRKPLIILFITICSFSYFICHWKRFADTEWILLLSLKAALYFEAVVENQSVKLVRNGELPYIINGCALYGCYGFIFGN